MRLVISSNVADEDEDDGAVDEDDIGATFSSLELDAASVDVVEGRTEDDEDAERMGSVAAVAAAGDGVSAAVVDVESLMMSLRTTFRLRFFELLVDSATDAVDGTGDRVGEVITYRDCDCSCCCGCGMAGEQTTFSLVFPRMGVLDGVVVAVVGVRGVAVSAPVDSKRRFFGVTTSSANNPTSFFFFFVDEEGEDR